jgi:hypothetical protein
MADNIVHNAQRGQWHLVVLHRHRPQDVHTPRHRPGPSQPALGPVAPIRPFRNDTPSPWQWCPQAVPKAANIPQFPCGAPATGTMTCMDACSRILETGCPLLDERRHALLLVLQRKARPELGPARHRPAAGTTGHQTAPAGAVPGNLQGATSEGSPHTPRSLLHRISLASRPGRACGGALLAPANRGM